MKIGHDLQGFEPVAGQMMRLETRDGRQMDALVTEATKTSVKLDGNHPLAGHDLTFDIELVGID